MSALNENERAEVETRTTRPGRHRFSAERAGHCCILGSCLGSAYMAGQP
jgi:hypothetical protein